MGGCWADFRGSGDAPTLVYVVVTSCLSRGDLGRWRFFGSDTMPLRPNLICLLFEEVGDCGCLQTLCELLSAAGRTWRGVGIDGAGGTSPGKISPCLPQL